MVEVRVLGPTTVGTDGADRPVRSAGQLLIIAHLALAEGHVVDQDVLVDEIWETPPADPLHALQAHVSRLRRATSLPVVHTGSGYHLDPELVRVDATAFESLLAHAPDAAPEAAVELLEEALGWWRGPALQGVPDTPRHARPPRQVGVAAPTGGGGPGRRPAGIGTSRGRAAPPRGVRRA